LSAVCLMNEILSGYCQGPKAKDTNSTWTVLSSQHLRLCLGSIAMKYSVYRTHLSAYRW
jgi:hypothetical protein